jgi:hypothetical protein
MQVRALVLLAEKHFDGNDLKPEYALSQLTITITAINDQLTNFLVRYPLLSETSCEQHPRCFISLAGVSRPVTSRFHFYLDFYKAGNKFSLVIC